MKRLVTGLWYWSSVIECVDSSGEQRWAHVTAQFHGVSAVLAAFPGWLAWLLCCVSMCCYVIPIQKPGQHWKSLPVSPDQFWKAFYTTFTNKDKIMTDESTEVLHHVVWEGYSLQWPRLYSNLDILCCVWKRCLSDSVFRSITEGWSLTLAMALPAQSEGLAAHEEIILLFSRIWPEAALEPLCFDATLSTIHVGNGNSKCSTLTLWSTPQTPPLLLHSSTPLSHYKMCLLISRESHHLLTAQLPHVLSEDNI